MRAFAVAVSAVSLLSLVSTASAQERRLNEDLTALPQGEITIVVNPQDSQHLVASWIDWDGNRAQGVTTFHARSLDGGQTWDVAPTVAPGVSEVWGRVDPARTECAETSTTARCSGTPPRRIRTATVPATSATTAPPHPTRARATRISTGRAILATVSRSTRSTGPRARSSGFVHSVPGRRSRSAGSAGASVDPDPPSTSAVASMSAR